MADSDVRISSIQYNPEGIDVVDNDEYVLIENTGNTDVDMGNWVLRDSQYHTYTPYHFRFPRIVLRPGAFVRVWTGKGQDNNENLHWGRGWAVWNNVGDTAVLLNAAGIEISRFSYGNAVPVPPSFRGLRILTWNIGEGIGLGDERLTLDEIARLLRQKNADIVLLNEVGYKWHQEYQDYYIATKAGYAYFKSVRTSNQYLDTRREKRVAVLSRYPLELVARIEHSHYFDGGGYATIHVSATIHGRRHHIFSTRFTAHTDIDPQENARSHAMMRDYINGLPAHHAVIMGGDFNTGYGRYDNEGLPTQLEPPPQYVDFMKRTHLPNVLGSLGWEYHSPDDQLVVRGPYAVSVAERFSPSPNPSDHPWVFAELTLLEGTQDFVVEEGAVVQEASSPDIYVIFGGAKFPVPDVETIERLYGSTTSLKFIADNSLANVPILPCNGTILKEETSPDVWLILDGVRRLITTPNALRRYGGSAAVRTVPDQTLKHLTKGDNDPLPAPPRSWVEYAPARIDFGKADAVNVTILADSVAENTVAFELRLGPGITWRKELIVYTTARPHLISVQDNNTVAVAAFPRSQLSGGRMQLKKMVGGGGMWDVHLFQSLYLDQLPLGARIIIEWVKDNEASPN